MPEADARCAAVDAAGAKRSQAIGTHHNSQAPHRCRAYLEPFPPWLQIAQHLEASPSGSSWYAARRRHPSTALLLAATATVRLHSAAWAPTTLARRHPRDPSTPRLGSATATAGLHIAAWTTMTTRFRSPMLSCRRGLAAWAPLGSPWDRGAASGRGRITWDRLNHTIRVQHQSHQRLFTTSVLSLYLRPGGGAAFLSFFWVLLQLTLEKYSKNTVRKEHYSKGDPHGHGARPTPTQPKSAVVSGTSVRVATPGTNW